MMAHELMEEDVFFEESSCNMRFRQIVSESERNTVAWSQPVRDKSSWHQRYPMDFSGVDELDGDGRRPTGMSGGDSLHGEPPPESDGEILELSIVGRVENGEVFLHNVHISPYTYATHTKIDPLRTRKLLLHKREIRKLIGKLHEKGIALIPLSIYFIGSGKAKVELGLARGKKLYDKRASLKQKQTDREIQREIRRKGE